MNMYDFLNVKACELDIIKMSRNSWVIFFSERISNIKSKQRKYCSGNEKVNENFREFLENFRPFVINLFFIAKAKIFNNLFSRNFKLFPFLFAKSLNITFTNYFQDKKANFKLSDLHLPIAPPPLWFCPYELR